jgi:hypothetical protein
MSFGKVFASLFEGSLYGMQAEQHVFVYMLANCSAEGVFDKIPAVISGATGLPLEDVESAIKTLEAPDEASRSMEFEGRRLLRLDEHRSWGWLIVNYKKYRDIRDEERRKEQFREASSRYRERQRASSPVNRIIHGQPKQKQKQIESKTLVHRDVVEREFEEFWAFYPRKTGKAAAAKVFATHVGPWYVKAALNPDEVNEDVLRFQRGYARAIEGWAAKGTEQQFIPHARTWLNQKRWEDES